MYKKEPQTMEKLMVKNVSSKKNSVIIEFFEDSRGVPSTKDRWEDLIQEKTGLEAEKVTGNVYKVESVQSREDRKKVLDTVELPEKVVDKNILEAVFYGENGVLEVTYKLPLTFEKLTEEFIQKIFSEKPVFNLQHDLNSIWDQEVLEKLNHLGYKDFKKQISLENLDNELKKLKPVLDCVNRIKLEEKNLTVEIEISSRKVIIKTEKILTVIEELDKSW